MISNPKALGIAVMASGLAHLFWISIVNVVIVPDTVKAVKFSKVYFLRPAISAGAFELNVRAREQSLVERRFSRYTDIIPSGVRISRPPDFSKDFYALNEDEISRLAADSVSSAKILPR
jgi:hypothetical protein